MESQTQASFPEEALEHVLSFIESRADQSSISTVCKSWYDIERLCRRHVFIGNCYSVNPPILTRRFPNVRSITIKGKHYASDYDLLPEGWGAHALPWIQALAEAYPAAMEEIRFKRMVVTDEGLELIGRNHNNLKSLILHRCEGFSTDGLASIAANCRNLRILDLCNSEVEDRSGEWITHFPKSYTSLEFLNIDRLLKSDLLFLECLVGKFPNLKALRLNASFPSTNLVSLLSNAPQLTDLGFPSLTFDEPCCLQLLTTLTTAFARLNGLERLSGLLDVTPYYLPAIYPLCASLSSLDLSNSTMRCPDLVKIIRHCPNLRCLWVLDFIEDFGLEEVAASCKKLQELRVLPSDLYEVDPTINITERGLISVAMGCPKVHRILYFCSQLTNETFNTIAKLLPNLTFFVVGTINPQTVDYLTGQPLDLGFISILQRCKRLKRFWTTGLVTDEFLEKMGRFGKNLEALGFTLAEITDIGLDHVLSGCMNLRKLAIRGCPIGGQAILANSDKLERMRFLYMFSCPVSNRICKLLAQKHPRLNVEVVNANESLHSASYEYHVEELYVYRTVAGTRPDMSAFVQNPNQDIST